jgi:hypothetical protein
MHVIVSVWEVSIAKFHAPIYLSVILILGPRALGLTQRLTDINLMSIAGYLIGLDRSEKKKAVSSRQNPKKRTID